MSKQTNQWYLLVVAILFSLIVLVAMHGVITYQTKVIKPQDESTEVRLASKEDRHRKRVAYYLIAMDDLDRMEYLSIPRQISSDVTGISNLIGELLNYKNDKNSHTFSLVPEKTVLRSVQIEGEVLVVDFSEEFRFNNWGSQGYEGQLGQILRTLASASPVRYAQIIVDGKKIDFLHEGVYIGLPIDLEPYRMR